MTRPRENVPHSQVKSAWTRVDRWYREQSERLGLSHMELEQAVALGRLGRAS